MKTALAEAVVGWSVWVHLAITVHLCIFFTSYEEQSIHSIHGSFTTYAQGSKYGFLILYKLT